MYKSAALAGLIAAAPGLVQASPLSFFDIVKNTDFLSAGAGGLRGTGSTDIELSGLTASPEKVYLYWHGPTNDDADGPLKTVTFNGTSVTGESIGTSDDNFWGRDNSQAYRADVTALVSGDGTYTVAGIEPQNGNGTSLVAFFDDGDDTNNRDMIVFNGNDANFDNDFDPLGWSFGALNVVYSGGPASIEFHVSDGQNFSLTDDSPLMLNGSVLADGGTFQGATVPFNPATTVGNGSLWDIISFDLTPYLSMGSNDLLFSLGSEVDALSLIFAAINLQAGSTDGVIPVDPDGPVMSAVPLPPSMLLLLGGLGAMVARRKRQS